ncbi:polyhydroxyalkanoic acid system family protein [Variovorax sp. JS1663]|uniref:polyhydroxyalkanoic acid system family protein n=1 Tax=Variovorax sp. JS1663 TaxID=1851577 RepID=UPI000B349F1D|nr:polyhydroxyalkanoic acid system family protein [Variovorax sp. JS1663]OUM02069.1 polyhydroxyalkanoic acid synthase [Variovorax sp. JS1663]
MPDIQIERSHDLGLTAARAIARRWVRQVEEDYGLSCSYQEGETQDLGRFSRAGVDGRVEVSADSFRLHATLAGLFGGFSEQIEQRLRQKLDELLGRGEGEDEDDAYNDKDWL